MRNIAEIKAAFEASGEKSFAEWIKKQPESSIVRFSNNSEAKLPSLAQRAVNLTVSTAQHLAAGRPIATEEEHARRWAICQKCEHLKDGVRCFLCGCGMEFKSTWQEQTCRDGRW